MTETQVRTILIAWMTQVLIIEHTSPLIEPGRFISSHQNTPVPEAPYIVINYAGIRNHIGRADYDANADVDGNTYLYSDIQLSTELRLVGGSIDILHYLRDSLERRDVYSTLLADCGISLWSTGEVQPIPRLTNADEWVREALLSLSFAIKIQQREWTGWIATVNAVWSDRPI